MLQCSVALRSVADLWVVLLDWTTAYAVGKSGESYPHAPGGSAHALSHHHCTKQQQPSVWRRNVCGLP